jgi:hypothetical protein
MSGKKGHFEKGRWIEDRDPEPGPEPAAPAAKERIEESSRPLPGAPVVSVEIERAARQAAENLERAVNEWAASARLALRKF